MPELSSFGRSTLLAFTVWSAIFSAMAQPGRDWGVERTTYNDPITGVRITELTGGTNTADNLYFHVSNFTADNRHVLFVSDRTGASLLYRAEVDSGRIIQLTDDPAIGARTACPDPNDPRRVFAMRGAKVVALDIADFSIREIGEIPGPHLGGFAQPTVSHDGQWLAVSKQRDAANWEVGLMSIANGQYRPVVTQGFRITHVQHSPTDPVIFYVWETGGYAPQRTWLVNDDGSANRPFYARTASTNWFTPLKEWVTHEAWVPGTGDMTMINDKLGVMLVSKDGGARLVREGNYWHAAARPDGKFMVLDDMQGRLWLCETATGNVRLLATGIRDQVRIHAHASFDRRGDYIQFHTGRTRETVALIDLRELPAQDWRR
ncbi:MAG: hypothetical protein IT581_23770 [Verrucomicrobiales bacterium]|nr:hypothetical protein [Verrucomicrobiales bacterium]